MPVDFLFQLQGMSCPEKRILHDLQLLLGANLFYFCFRAPIFSSIANSALLC
jgi:hypothetical protein